MEVCCDTGDDVYTMRQANRLFSKTPLGWLLRLRGHYSGERGGWLAYAVPVANMWRQGRYMSVHCDDAE